MKNKTRWLWLTIFCVLLWHFDQGSRQWRMVAVYDTYENCDAARSKALGMIVLGAYQPLGLCLSAS